MSCRIQKLDGTVEYTLPNKKESQLFKALKAATENNNEAERFYNEVRSTEFKKWYGKDWEKDYTVDLFLTDENGEPKLVKEEGFYSFQNAKGEIFKITAVIPDPSNSLNLGREVQGALIDTLVGFITKVRRENPRLFRSANDAIRYFGIGKDSASKGALANKLLMEAFPGATFEQAKEAYEVLIDQGAEAMFDSLPEGVGLNEAGTEDHIAWEVFTAAYHNWNSSFNETTGNIENIGVREILANSLSTYGMKLRDRVGSMEEFEDTYERIHDLSRLEDNPQDKLSAEAKAVLGNIETNELNAFGYPAILSMDKAYAIMAEAAVGQPTWAEMKSNLDFRAQYNPASGLILEKVNKLTSQEEAALFTTFKSAYNNFILFKNDSFTNEITGKTTIVNKIINSNQSEVNRKAKELFRQNSRELQIPNPRALYSIDTDNKLTVKEGKVERLTELWETINNVRNKKDGEFNPEDINALGEYLWILGIQYGPTLETTQDNLLDYYILGNEEGLKGKNLFSQFIFKSGDSFIKLLDSVKKGKDIYTDQSSLIDKLSDISTLFENKPFGSFISGTGKHYYPINLPTRLHELVSTINNPKEADETIRILNQFLEDPLNRPFASVKHSSPLITALHASEEVRGNFIHEVLDSYKSADEFIASADYGNQSSKISLIERLLAYENRGKKDFWKIALPIQAGRSSLDFLTIPRISSYKEYGMTTNKRQLIENIILQDLARMNQADEFVENNDPSKFIEGYHYKKGSNPYAKDGGAFTMTQISDLNLNKIKLKDGKYIYEHAKPYVLGVDFNQKEEFTKILGDSVTIVENKLLEYEQDLKNRIDIYGIKLLEEVNPNLKTKELQDKLIKDFTFENFIGKIEITKMLRGGFSFTKDAADFYKRMSLLKTPGNKLFIKGMSKTNPEYGMAPTYNALVIKDFDFTDLDRSNEVADNLEKALTPEGTMLDPVAEELASNYRSVNKSDAQSFISLPMYRDIMQGMGQWNNLDEEAFRNAQNPEIGQYIDNNGNTRPIYPLKPFHEELSFEEGVNTLYMDKNSYTVVTPELAMFYPYLNNMLEAMNNGIDVVHTESATKGARRNVQNFQANESLDYSNPTIMDSNMLRFPQLSPRRVQDQITFNKQIRKNLIANVYPDASYTLGDTTVPGSKLNQIYGEAVAENIKEDKETVDKELGITELKRVENKQGTKEYKDAKLKYLKGIRNKMITHIKDKDLPDNYLDSLAIVPNGAFDWAFKIPLAFPNYQAKFEGIFMSMYNNEVFKQKLKGKELVQIAELGGHEVSGELKFYDGTNAAQVRIKASAIGIAPGTPIKDVPVELLQMIGYRIPQQGKNSSVFMQVVDFLPESHEKAIMVPGALTVQMGSDFDFDKLNVILPETNAEGNVIKPDYSKQPSEMNRGERNNVIFDVFRSILTDPKHLTEVIKPLDIQTLEEIQEFLDDKTNIDTTLDYNNPMAELAMEERAKEGDRLIGLWAKHIAGRNVAEAAGTLRLKSSFMPIINGESYGELGRTRDDNGNYADANISEHMSAAVDSAKNPIQIDINDNIYTNPVLGLFYSLGIPIETALIFVNQPIIREAIEDAKNNSRPLNELYKSINRIYSSYQKEIEKVENMETARILGYFVSSNNINMQGVQGMNTNELNDQLVNPNQAKQLEYLSNFNKFVAAGRALQVVNSIITPDNLDNVNEISSLNDFIDIERQYLNNPESIIDGADEIIMHNQGTNTSLNPIAVAYRGLFTTILEESARAGFVNNSPAFRSFKSDLKDAIGASKFTAAQHKLIDRALFTKIITQPHSPFVDGGLISRENFENMYLKPNDNLITKLNYLRETYPELNNNLIMQALQEDPSNNETKLFLLRLDLPVGISTTDKNNYTKAFRDLLNNSNEEINDFAHALVVNQILTSGFNPTFGSYIDLIPSEVFTTSILNPSKQSPVEFFRQEMKELNRVDYFKDFVHEFIRTYGTEKPGGVPILKKIDKIKMSPDGFTNVSSKNLGIYGPTNESVDYFVSDATGNTNVFVRVEGLKYQRLSLLGKSRKLNESGISTSNSESLVNFTNNTTIEKPGGFRVDKSADIITNNEDSQAQKYCKK